MHSALGGASGRPPSLGPARPPSAGLRGVAPPSAAPTSGASAPTPVAVDDLGRLRLLPPAVADAAESLRDETRDFALRLDEFLALVQDLVEVVDARAKEIETAKLRALALRTRADREPARRMTELNRLSYVLRERQLELDRLTAQHETYLKMEQEQKSVMDALTFK
ncbi:Intraflagellar transport protein 20 [Allomyces arbusculus]|nr:Intraflagellar transport protein 20 [Allomyces arbusculus]